MATQTKAVVRRTPVAVEVNLFGSRAEGDDRRGSGQTVSGGDQGFESAVQRNLWRFPDDFMFRLTLEEAGRGGRRYLPLVFTEHGVVMLSSVLKSERSVQMNILVVRAFVKLREMLASHKDLAHKMIDLERQQRQHGQQLAAVYTMVRRLMEPERKTQTDDWI